MKRSAVGTVGAVFAVAVVALGMPTSAVADDQILEPGMPCPAPVVDCGGGEPDPWEPLLTFEGHFYFVHPDFPGGQYVATERPDKDERCTWSRYDDAGLVESHSSYRDSHVVNLTVGTRRCRLRTVVSGRWLIHLSPRSHHRSAREWSPILPWCCPQIRLRHTTFQ